MNGKSNSPQSFILQRQRSKLSSDCISRDYRLIFTDLPCLSWWKESAHGKYQFSSRVGLEVRSHVITISMVRVMEHHLSLCWGNLKSSMAEVVIYLTMSISSNADFVPLAFPNVPLDQKLILIKPFAEFNLQKFPNLLILNISIFYYIEYPFQSRPKSFLVQFYSSEKMAINRNSTTIPYSLNCLKFTPNSEDSVQQTVIITKKSVSNLPTSRSANCDSIWKIPWAWSDITEQGSILSFYKTIKKITPHKKFITIGTLLSESKFTLKFSSNFVWFFPSTALDLTAFDLNENRLILRGGLRPYSNFCEDRCFLIALDQ